MMISVLTSAIPERRQMLDEAIASVRAQTWPEVEHLYAFDEERQGAGPVLNRLLEEARGEWVMVLDDDDLLDPDHLKIVATANPQADVVYSQPRVEGGVFVQYGQPFDPLVLATRNIVSHNALMRRSLVDQVGGWRPLRTFDWDMFQRLESAGAEFHQLHDVTWTYRLHGANWSHGTLEGAP